MATPVIMPKQGQSVETCLIIKWFKQKGDKVRTGDLLFSYETDKAAFDMEAPSDGTLLEIFYGNGSEVPVLVNVAIVGEVGESVESFVPSAPYKTPEQESEKGSTSGETVINHNPSVVNEESDKTRIRISPRAKRFAGKHGLDYAGIPGSGPNGRIICSDIQNALAGSDEDPVSARNTVDEFTVQPLSNIRKMIAKAMHASLQNSAQLTHHMSADVRNLLEARRKIKERIQNGNTHPDITLNDMICMCVIKALLKFPEMNCHLLGESIKIFNKVHLGFAVDTPRGLMVPVVKNADEMDLVKLSAELKSAAESCKKGSINPELIQSTAASFTVSNLGNYGVEIFTPVVNLPQCAILGVCTIINRPADLGNNTFGFIPFIGLSLTYDHRAVDGGPATIFLREIKDQIEKFRY
jgi:pyruvate dehydrogenase E2 component (dihydrolipoamide acetyltransferase)